MEQEYLEVPYWTFNGLALYSFKEKTSTDFKQNSVFSLCLQTVVTFFLGGVRGETWML